MPALNIYIAPDPDQHWVVSIPNGGPSYSFSGEELQEQVYRVEQFAMSMEHRDLEGITELFEGNVPESDVLAEQLFEGTDSLVLSGDVIYTAAEGESLLDQGVLEEAGAILLELL